MKVFFKILLCLIVYLLFGLALVALTGGPGKLFFVWNVFLAFLPLLFARHLRFNLMNSSKSKFVLGLWFALWLLFYPNAPYMVTDLIYFGGTKYITAEGYTTSLSAWMHLVYLAGGVLFAAVMGLFSLYDIHAFFKSFMSRAAAFAALALCCLLSGFGIYIGRMLRFNSWDILRPYRLLAGIREDLSAFSIAFSLLFALLIFGGYVVFYTLLESARRHSENPGR
jgi:uncharacterized membrane protein